MKDFQLPFDLQACQQLDEFACLASQDYNLGGKGDWFGCFRRGLYGFYARIYGIKVHYYDVHSWRLTLRGLTETEYHLSSIFFNMDSAVECFVYTMNALGYAAAPLEFLDLENEKKLKQVAPRNILGGKRHQPLVGYSHLFPTLQVYWQANETLLSTIMEQHDVSKHRSRLSVTGKSRMDAPQGFFESLGVGDDPGLRFNFSPMEEIRLDPNPKLPLSKQKHGNYSDLETLERVTENFCEFINISSIRLYTDSINNIKLSHQKFLQKIQIVYWPNVDLYEDAECTKIRNGVTGVILAMKTSEYGISDKSKLIVPTQRLTYYQKNKYISNNPTSWNLENIWGESWYINPDDGQKKLAWSSSGEFIGDHIV